MGPEVKSRAGEHPPGAEFSGLRRFAFQAALLVMMLVPVLFAWPTTLDAQASRSAGSGIAPTSSVVSRVLLLLKPAEAQTKALNALLDAQQTPGNASYHQWLTPGEFAVQFGPAAADAAKVSGWLRAAGFTVAPLPASRGWVEFSGTRAQVEQTFRTRLIAAGTDGVARLRFAGQPTIPGALQSVVAGVVSLDGSLAEAALTPVTVLPDHPRAMATASSLGTVPALTPALVSEAIGLSASNATSAGNSGTGNTGGQAGAGETIAIPARSDVYAEDFAGFRQTFGLSTSDTLLTVLPSGVDPGHTADEAVAQAMASWTTATAPGAKLVIVPAATTNATDGLDLALAAIIDGALAHTVSVGYTSCETGMSAAHQGFYAALYRQAAAEGIAVIAATGDNGAAGCHAAGDASPVASGYAVNALASTPWNTAVGAGVVSEVGSEQVGSGVAQIAGWGQRQATDPAYATGGGASTVYATPTWQSAAGLPTSDPGSQAGHHRYLPDVVLPGAFTASGASSNTGSGGAAFCFSGDQAPGGCRLVSASGSAISAAVMAGLSAELAARYGAQGNLAPNLYRLARAGAPGSSERSGVSGSSEASAAAAATSTSSSTPSQAMTDVQSGAALLYCKAGSPGCGNPGGGSTDSNAMTASGGANTIGFSASQGFDLATGLGTVNAQALLADWSNSDATGTLQAQVEMTNLNGLTYNPSTYIDLTAKVTSLSGGPVPTGTIQFYDQTSQQNTGTPVTLASDGTASYTEPAQFTVGGHNIEAIYSGDSNYAGGTSLPVTFNIQPSISYITIAPSTTTPSPGASVTVTGTITSPNLGNSPPTGLMTLNLDGIPQGTAKLSTTSGVTTATYNLTAPTSGSHTLQAIYSGDVNYNQSTSPSVTITIAKQATVVALTATPSTLSAAMPESFTATIAPATKATTTYTITGTVSFFDGTTLLGTSPVVSNTAVLANITLSPSVPHTITAVYSGDTTWATSTSSPLVLEPILLPVTVTLTSSSPVLSPGQAANLTATVTPVAAPPAAVEQNPTGNVFFYAGTTLVGEGKLAAGLADTAVASLAVPTLPGGQYLLTAVYSGDTVFGGATSNALGFAVESFTISSATNGITIMQGQSATVPFTITATGGLTGSIQILCAEQNPPTAGAISCTFNPTIVNGTEVTTLTITTYAGPVLAANRAPSRPAGRGSNKTMAGSAGGALLALAGMLLWPPSRRRARWLRAARSLSVAGLLLVGVTFLSLGCSGTTSSSSGATTAGTPLGVATLQITGAAYVNNVTVSNHAYLTVNVVPAS